MTEPLGVDLPFKLFFWKGGTLTDPAVAPTATLEYPDKTFLLPAPTLINYGPGRYSYTLPGANNNQAGALTLIATTTDTSMDNTASMAVWEVGTNDVPSIWTNATRTLTSFGSLVSAIFSELVPGTYPGGSAGAALGRIGSGSGGLVTQTITGNGRWKWVKGYDFTTTTGNPMTYTFDAADLVPSPDSITFVAAGVTVTGTLAGQVWTGNVSAAQTNAAILGSNQAGIFVFHFGTQSTTKVEIFGDVVTLP